MNKEIPIQVLFKFLLRDYKANQVELSEEKAYNEELKKEITELKTKFCSENKQERKEALKEIKREEAYKTFQQKITALEKHNRTYKELYNKTSSQLVLLKEKIKQYREK